MSISAKPHRSQDVTLASSHIPDKPVLSLYSAQEQVSSKSGKITVARKALQIWSETFDYSAAAGKSAEPDRAAAAAAFAEAAKDDVRMAATTGQRNVIMA